MEGRDTPTASGIGGKGLQGRITPRTAQALQSPRPFPYAVSETPLPLHHYPNKMGCGALVGRQRAGPCGR
eukprot:4554696-Alexandrium_andersonii.AAC.1